MKISTFVVGLFLVGPFLVGLFLVGMAPSAIAQGIPEDVRCLVLSNLFAKSGADARGRQVAGQTMLFYVGRLDGRADARTIVNAMRAQGRRIDPRAAATEMSACAARLARAEQTIQALGRTAAPAK
jgi:hypothetical protein